MTLAAGAFLGGAAGRLLPASVPFRYFATAVAYHVLAWLALLAGARDAPRFAGGLDWPLAALHLTTLGVVVMTAIGASLQLLPVATLQPVRAQRWAAALWWLYTPGVAAVALGMGLPAPAVLGAGAVAVVAALLVFAALFARNLWGAAGMPVVIAHGWVAWVSLAVALVTALSLAGTYVGAPALDRRAALALHVAFAAYGFMGMLAVGLSCILVPMFALSEAPAERPALASCVLAAVALVLAGLAAGGVVPMALRTAAIAAGAVAVALHLALMQRALRTGMRRDLGRGFLLVRGAWAMLAASLALALPVTLELPVAGIATLFGIALVPGWLLTFLLGMLQRIVPFLASLHAPRGAGRRPTPSMLTAERPLAIHGYCHAGALTALCVAAILDSALFAGAAAVLGAAGAAAFAVFFVTTLRRMRGATAPESRA